MQADFQIMMYDQWGNRVSTVPRTKITKLTYTMSVNAVGAATIALDRSALPDQYIAQDTRFEILRKPDGGHWTRESDGYWLLQKDTVGQSAQDGKYRKLALVTNNNILDREAVVYYANSAQTQKSGLADNMIKAIVRENLGSTANAFPKYVAGVSPSRDLVTPGLLVIDADKSAGPSTSKGFAYRNVLSVLQEICRDAATSGTPVFFDVILDGQQMTFRTYVGQRGADLSSGPGALTISAKRGTLGGTIEKTTDWSATATGVIVGGQGQDANRVLGSAFDLTTANRSPFGARYVFVDATSLTDQNSLDADARAELRSRRVKKVLTGSIQNIPGCTYGLDWWVGCRIGAEHEGDAFIAFIDSVTVSMDKKTESVTAAIRGEV